MKRLRMAVHGGAAPLKLVGVYAPAGTLNVGQNASFTIYIEGGVPPFTYALMHPYTNSPLRVFATTDARQASTVEAITVKVASSYWAMRCTDALGASVAASGQFSVNFAPTYATAWASVSALASGEGANLQWSSDLGNPKSPLTLAWYMRKNGGAIGYVGNGNYFTAPAADPAGTTYDFYLSLSNPMGSINSNTFRITKK